MGVVESSSVVFGETGDEVVNPSCLRRPSGDLVASHHTQICLPCLFSRSRHCASYYDYPYLLEQGSRSFLGSPVGFEVPRRVLSCPNELLQLPLLDECFDILLEVVAFGGVMPVVSMEVILLIPGPFVWITL